LKERKNLPVVGRNRAWPNPGLSRTRWDQVGQDWYKRVFWGFT